MKEFSLELEAPINGVYLNSETIELLSIIQCKDIEEIKDFARNCSQLKFSKQDIMDLNGSNLEDIKRELVEQYKNTLVSMEQSIKDRKSVLKSVLENCELPEDEVDSFEKNANENYTVIYNPTKTLDEQNISKIAKGIIAILFRDYWATEVQKKKIIAKQNYMRQKLEGEKTKKYNPDSIFGDNKKKYDVSLIKIEKEKWYEKIYSFFRKFLNKLRIEIH